MTRQRNTATRALVIGCAMVAIPLATMTPVHAEDKGASLTRGEYLNKGDFISRVAQEGRVQLKMQDDGNLVLRFVPTGLVCWNAGTAGRGHHAVYQRDGNFVVVNSGGAAIWNSGTVGTPAQTGTTVDINSYGRLYVGSTNISVRTCP